MWFMERRRGERREKMARANLPCAAREGGRDGGRDGACLPSLRGAGVYLRHEGVTSRTALDEREEGEAVKAKGAEDMGVPGLSEREGGKERGEDGKT